MRARHFDGGIIHLSADLNHLARRVASKCCRRQLFFSPSAELLVPSLRRRRQRVRRVKPAPRNKADEHGGDDQQQQHVSEPSKRASDRGAVFIPSHACLRRSCLPRGRRVSACIKSAPPKSERKKRGKGHTRKSTQQRVARRGSKGGAAHGLTRF
jgi:hypothetical protein